MNTTAEIIEDIRQGKMVVLMDDEDRENEGDVVMAAEKVTAAHINFMARYARGLICLPLSPEHCERLRLPLMVRDNNARFKTNFTVSIEAAEGVTTGISAQDRAQTILTAVSPEAKPEDLVQPGHIFPIMAQPGGVLVRAGHTEATVDLARLAGLQPAAVLCEILNDDGTMARRDQLAIFAKTHGLKQGTIADLIRYRLEKEPTVRILSRAPHETPYGVFELLSFYDTTSSQTHFALLKGKPTADKPSWVRVQINNPLWQIPGMKRSSDKNHWDCDSALRWIAQAGEGITLLLQPQDLSLDSSSHNETLIGVGSQILSLLGFGKIRVLGRQKSYLGLSGFGLEVVEYLSYADISESDRVAMLKSDRSEVRVCAPSEIA